jgi:acrylyl-CoA reductase (NADPH)
METFKALVLEQEEGNVQATIKPVGVQDLPEGEVLVSVAYSSLNYKDGLAITGKGKIVRNYPMVPGVDFVGTVVESQSPDVQSGDEVILTGWGVGENHWGGYAQRARVPAGWLVRRPDGLSMQHAMAIGTAGFTAMQCVMALEEHDVVPDSGKVLVTGASGGVGSMAVAILSTLGYQVAASTGRSESHDYLTQLGASEIVGREVLSAESKRPLESQRWSGAVDTVGGATLAGVLRSLSYGGSVAACGLAGGSDLPTTVFPFILRGVNLLGIDSVQCPLSRRKVLWERLANVMPATLLDTIMQVAPLEQMPALSEDILKGQVRGRVVVDVGG